MASLVEYGGSDDEEQHVVDAVSYEKPENSIFGDKTISLAPDVHRMMAKDELLVDPKSKELLPFNPTVEQLYRPDKGPVNPFKTESELAMKNSYTGFVEPAHFNEFHFENQRRTFNSYGFAHDPTENTDRILRSDAAEFDGASDVDKTVFEKTKKREKDKRKRERNVDSEDVEGYTGPWSKFKDEVTVSKPNEEDKKYCDEYMLKMSQRKTGRVKAEKEPVEDSSVLHVDSMHDYQGRTLLEAVPNDVGVSLKPDAVPDKCFLPKRQIHSFKGHSKGVARIRLFPRSGHLMLSGCMDTKIKLWEVYHDRRCIRTYSGHSMAIKDLDFNFDGTQFISSSYDRTIKLWDTETGQVKGKFSNKKVSNCIKFHPDPNRQHLFVAGCTDRKVVTWDIRSGHITMDYDRHLGAVNSITFVDRNRRMVTTSDDKTIRVWEWNIPVDFIQIQDPTMHSMPAVALSPNGKFMLAQSMDNQILCYNALTNFKQIKKKVFKGHMVSGFACTLDFSPDMQYVTSGDGDGKIYIWDWKSTRLFSKFKAHDQVAINVLWHPHETSKVLSCSWDGSIKMWD